MSDYARLELASTNRSSCQVCKQPIQINQVRLRLGWAKGAKYFHPACAVKNNWFNLLSAASVPISVPLDEDVREACIKLQECSMAKLKKELEAERSNPLPAIAVLESEQKCIHCKKSMVAGTKIIKDHKGPLHIACTEGWLNTGIVDPDRWIRALRENTLTKELDELNLPFLF